VGTGLTTAALGTWTAIGKAGLVTVAGIGITACAAYAYYLIRRYRVRCPECEYAGAHFARDMKNRMLLVCPECGLRASTGRRVIADSPSGH
jgi:DNA-directed RNA polymerase subunit RPC12/RpoP